MCGGGPDADDSAGGDERANHVQADAHHPAPGKDRRRAGARIHRLIKQVFGCGEDQRTARRHGEDLRAVADEIGLRFQQPQERGDFQNFSKYRRGYGGAP